MISPQDGVSTGPFETWWGINRQMFDTSSLGPLFAHSGLSDQGGYPLGANSRPGASILSLQEKVLIRLLTFSSSPVAVMCS